MLPTLAGTATYAYVVSRRTELGSRKRLATVGAGQVGLDAPETAARAARHARKCTARFARFKILIGVLDCSTNHGSISKMTGG